MFGLCATRTSPRAANDGYNAGFVENRPVEFVTIPLLALHLLAMNIASAGPLVGAWLGRRERAGSGVNQRLGLRLIQRSMAGLAVGALSGGVILMLPHEGMRAALSRFPSDAYWYAGAELVFSAACMAGALWLMRGDRPAGGAAIGLATVTATNLLYHFPPLMAVLGELAADSNWSTAETIDRQTLLELWKRPEIIFLWAHFAVASFAVAAIAAVWPTSALAADAEGEAELDKSIRRLGVVGLSATIVQLPIGVCLLATDSAAARDAMLGQNLLASLAFAASLLTAFALMQALGAMAWGEGPRAVRRTGWLLIAVVVLMAATLRTSRDAKTRGGDVASPPRDGNSIHLNAGQAT